MTGQSTLAKETKESKTKNDKRNACTTIPHEAGQGVRSDKRRQAWVWIMESPLLRQEDGGKGNQHVFLPFLSSL